MKAIKTALIALATALISGCSNDDDPGQGNNERRDITLSRGAEEIVNANNAFAFKLMDELSDEGENIVISPLSLYQYLSMVANGADGDTKREIEAVLGAGELSMDEINVINSDLVSSLRTADKKTTFTLSNSLWQSKDINILPDYATTLKKYYAAESHVLNSLSSAAARKEINKWCEKSTGGVIKNFLQENLNDGVKYALYNAAYFKSEWSEPFNVDAKGEFHNSDESVSTATYIKGTLSCKYFSNSDFQYIEIPYGNKAFAFSIILPKGNGPFSVEAASSEINEIMVGSEITIVMPKFKVDFKKEMREILREMGIYSAFTSVADFSKVSSYSQSLPEILHAASIIVDEKGTVAVAASGMGFTGIPKIIKVDRPFIFFIKETSTSTILFIGKVNRL